MQNKNFDLLKNEEKVNSYAVDSYISRCVKNDIFAYELKNEKEIYEAGCDCEIFSNILRQAFLKLKEEEWIYKAGRDWNLSTNETPQLQSINSTHIILYYESKAFEIYRYDKDNEEFNLIGSDLGIAKEILQETFLKLKEEKWISLADKHWKKY